jgi:hypothetical protein
LVWNIDLEKWGTLKLEGEKSGEHQLKKWGKFEWGT